DDVANCVAGCMVHVSGESTGTLGLVDFLKEGADAGPTYKAAEARWKEIEAKAMNTMIKQQLPNLAKPQDPLPSQEPIAGGCPKCGDTANIQRIGGPGSMRCQDCGHQWNDGTGKPEFHVTVRIGRPKLAHSRNSHR